MNLYWHQLIGVLGGSTAARLRFPLLFPPSCAHMKCRGNPWICGAAEGGTQHPKALLLPPGCCCAALLLQSEGGGGRRREEEGGGGGGGSSLELWETVRQSQLPPPVRPMPSPPSPSLLLPLRPPPLSPLTITQLPCGCSSGIFPLHMRKQALILIPSPGGPIPSFFHPPSPPLHFHCLTSTPHFPLHIYPLTFLPALSPLVIPVC